MKEARVKRLLYDSVVYVSLGKGKTPGAKNKSIVARGWAWVERASPFWGTNGTIVYLQCGVFCRTVCIFQNSELNAKNGKVYHM